MFAGADPFASDNEDMWLMPDPKDPTKVVFVEPPCDAVQNFITLGPEEYAVIHNPSISFTDDHPNGSWKSGKGDLVKDFTDSCRKQGLPAGLFIEASEDVRLKVHAFKVTKGSSLTQEEYDRLVTSELEELCTR